MVKIGELEIAQVLHDFVATELTPGTAVSAADFWASLEAILVELGPRNATLLARRDELQARIDEWHLSHRDRPSDRTEPSGSAGRQREYVDFLRSIGYLDDAPTDVAITTDDVDPEITSVAGPQLVVPLDNSRYALNAANARWGSLYDAFYGTDVISDEGGGRGRVELQPGSGRQGHRPRQGLPRHALPARRRQPRRCDRLFHRGRHAAGDAGSDGIGARRSDPTHRLPGARGDAVVGAAPQARAPRRPRDRPDPRDRAR